MKYLLNARERKAVSHALQAYRKKFHKDPMTDPDLVIFLGDNPAERLSWSAVSGRLPTLRMNRGKLYSPMRKRWFLGFILLS